MKIGFIGLGVMGNAMSSNIVKKHSDEVYVFDVKKDKVCQLEELGALGCESARETAQKADCIFSIVPRAAQVEQICEEILPVLGRGKIWVEMSTIDPADSMAVAKKVMETGAQFADCPVVKSKPAAIAGKLGIYVGASKETYQAILPVLEYMGEHILHMGDVGKGIVMKVCHNSLVHEIQNAVNETMTLAGLYGIGVQAFADAVSIGGGQNFYLESKVEAIKREDWACAFPVEYAAKDLAIGGRLGDAAGLPMPGLQAALDTMMHAIDMGLGKQDNSASILAVRDRIGVAVKAPKL
ncbi:MAG: NAD(P)-dependent oxidoreductase [Lachnospiraceae bacterium]|nr:NAD(P)-dependent oxidoreductase [Lachnospiraceae bacterium]